MKLRSKHFLKSRLQINLTTLVFAALVSAANAQDAPPKMKMSTETPPDITTPNKIDTRLGELKFFDGYPDKDTVQKVYDNLDFQRGVDVFLNTMPGASLYAMREGLRGVGVNNHTVVVFETLMGFEVLVPDGEHRHGVSGWMVGFEGRSLGGRECAEHARHPR